MTSEDIKSVASKLVSGLSAQPILLFIVVLNAIGIGAAIWFLQRLVEISGANMQTILKACLPGSN